MPGTTSSAKWTRTASSPRWPAAASDYPGDGEAATNVSLNNPQGVAVDASGNLVIADTGDNLIRRVACDGLITTVAGNGTNAYSGDGGTATNASLANPQDVAVDAPATCLLPIRATTASGRWASMA